MKKRILYSILLFTCLGGNSQTPIIDSLKLNIQQAQPGSGRIKAIFALCDLGYTLHPDTLMRYAENAKQLAEQLNDQHARVTAMYYQTGALTTKGLLDSSLKLANSCLDLLSKGINDPILQANLYNQKGRCFVRKNKYKEAIDMGYQTISLAEKNNDVLLQVKGKTLIGWAYLEMGQLNDALNWHLQALHTTTDTLLLGKYAILFANLANNYNGVGKTDSAFYYIHLGIHYARKYENLFALSNCLAIESELYVKSGQAKLSEPILKEVVAIRKTIGDPFYIASDMSQLGFYYAHYGQPEKGVAICNEGIAIAKKYKLDTKLFFLYGSLADNYKAMGNTAKYAGVLEDIIALKDSVYHNNSVESLAEMQAKYDLQKEQNLIIQQKLDIQQKNYFIYGTIMALLIILISSWFIFRLNKRKQQIKIEQVQAEEKILSAIAVTRAEEIERKRIAADLHDNIGAYASAIRADIEKISDHNFGNNSSTLQSLEQHSQEIIDSLRDTIWVLNKEHITITGISDRIKYYLNKLKPTYSQIQFHLKEEIIRDVRISSRNALNIFRIVQEAVHNAVKHSNASNISIDLISSSSIMISISDDGKGMEGQFNRGEGNGMFNMNTRATESGFQLQINSEPGKGTKVFLASTTTN